MLTTKEAAKLLAEKGIQHTPEEISELAKNGVFPNAHKLDNRWQIPESNLQLYASQRTKKRRGNVLKRIISSGAILFIAAIISAANDFWGLLDRFSGTNPISPFEAMLLEGCNSLSEGKIEIAEEKFQEAQKLNPGSPMPWYWRAKIASDRQHSDIAISYIEEALKIAPSHTPSVILKVTILLIDTQHAKAEQVSRQKFGNEDELDTWFDCLADKQFYSPSRPLITSAELISLCPTPIITCLGDTP